MDGGGAPPEDEFWGTSLSAEDVSRMDDESAAEEYADAAGRVHRMLRKNKLFMRCVREVFQLMSTPEDGGFGVQHRIRGGGGGLGTPMGGARAEVEEVAGDESTQPGPAGATPKPISTARSGAMTRMPRRPTPTRGSTRRAKARRRSCASWGMV